MRCDLKTLLHANGRRLSEVATAMGVHKSTITRWAMGDVPAERVIEVEKFSGISRSVLRPDLYPDHRPAPSPSCEEDGAPAASCHANPLVADLREGVS